MLRFSQFEKCLLKAIPELLTSRVVISFSDDQVSDLAAESEEARTERTRVGKEYTILSKARTMLRRLYQSHPSNSPEVKSVQGRSIFETVGIQDTLTIAPATPSLRSASPANSSTKELSDIATQDCEETVEATILSDPTHLSDDFLENGLVQAPNDDSDSGWGLSKKHTKRKNKKR